MNLFTLAGLALLGLVILLLIVILIQLSRRNGWTARDLPLARTLWWTACLGFLQGLLCLYLGSRV